MTYPAPFLRLVMAGPLYGAERWSASLAFAEFETGFGTAPTEVSTAVRTAIEAWLGNTAQSTAAKLDSIKLNLIGVDGKYVSANTVEHIYTTLPAGTANSFPAPQVALAISLQSNVARGYASKGRFYLPAPVFGPVSATDGRLPVANQGTYLTNATALINGLNAALTPWRAAITSNVGTGFIREVKSVRVGRVLDTMRSRRTSLNEEYAIGTQVTGYGEHGIDASGTTF